MKRLLFAPNERLRKSVYSPSFGGNHVAALLLTFLVFTILVAIATVLFSAPPAAAQDPPTAQAQDPPESESETETETDLDLQQEGVQASKKLQNTALGTILQTFCLLLALLSFVYALIQAVMTRREGERGGRILTKLAAPFCLSALLFNIWWTASALAWGAGLIVQILKSLGSMFGGDG